MFSILLSYIIFFFPVTILLAFVQFVGITFDDGENVDVQKTDLFAGLILYERHKRKDVNTNRPSSPADDSASNSYNRRKWTNKKWTSEEIQRLRKCIKQFGNEYTAAYKLFPDRTERAVLQKYKKESNFTVVLESM